MSKPMSLGEERDAFLSKPFKETSLDEQAALFLGSAKPETQWFLGMELELLGFRVEDRRPPDYEALARILAALGRERQMSAEHDSNGALVGLKGAGQIVSLEPGGQLEFASRPHRSLKALRREILGYADDLRRVAAREGVSFWAMGHHPFATLDSIPKMPKPRYERMRSFFANKGRLGRDMMHLTGSVQCTVDFLDEANLVNKVRTAARASPFITALVAASPFYEGRPSGFKTRRYQIWLETDDERSGIWPEMLDEEGMTARRYIRRALDTSPMFFLRDGQYRAAEPKPYAHYVEAGFEGTTVTVSDFLDHLTALFPEIRPKGYVELRGADCIPPAEMVALAGLWRGLLDDEDCRREVDDLLKPMDYAAVRALQPQVARLGLEANSAAGPVRRVVEALVKLGHGRLGRDAPDCAECVEPLVARAEAGRCPADEMLEIAATRGIAEALRAFEF